MSNVQHEHLPPAGHVQACPVITHDDVIDEGIATTRLAAGSFPAIIRALNLIREDSGGPSWPPEEAPLVASRWLPWLDRIEAAIAALRDDAPAPEDSEAIERVAREGFCYLDGELYTFCNGEETAMLAITARSPDLAVASRFLNDFFEGWTHFEDEGFDPLAVSDG